MRSEAAIFLMAVQFLTRLPIPSQSIFTPDRLEASTRYYPLVGLLIGALCALAFWLSDLLFAAPIALIIAITVGLLITGAFHEDGLADTFDGIGGGHDRAQVLDIMKDSRLGTYGTLALIMAMALKFLALFALPSIWVITALIAAHAISRLSSVLVIATSNYARPDGKAKPVASGISAIGLSVAALTGIAALIGVGLVLPLPAVAAGLAGLALGHIAMRLFFERKLGGYTGDALGAVQQASEIGFYLGLAAWLS